MSFWRLRASAESDLKKESVRNEANLLHHGYSAAKAFLAQNSGTFADHLLMAMTRVEEMKVNVRRGVADLPRQ